MRKVQILLILLMVALLAVSCGQKKEAEPTLTTSPSFASFDEAKAAANGKPILIDFYTDWCTWCKKIDTEVYTDPTVIEFFKTDMILAKVNAEQDTILARQFNISGYPTLVLTNSAGEEIDRIIGYMPAPELLQTLKDYQNGIGTLSDLLAKVETSPDRTLYFEIADKYKYRGGAEDAVIWYQKVIDEGDMKDSLSGESRMSLADMFRRNKEYDKALGSFTEIMKDFKGSMLAQDAEIWKAIVYRQMDDTTKAIAAFEGFIKNYPESEDVEYAQSQIEKLKAVDTTK